MSNATSDACLVDAHVHIYSDVAPQDVLSAAAGHMARAAQEMGLPRRPPGMLVLTEVAGLDRFAELQGRLGGWQIAPVDEEVSCLAHPADGSAPLAVTSGRQIVTREGLEVHALGTRSTFPDGRPLADMLEAIRADGALAVLPWGVGKWVGRRGGIITELIAEAEDSQAFCLADSGVRCFLMARSTLLAKAETKGIRVLAGSDPLPLMGGVRNTGRFGIVARHAFDAERPFAAFRAWLQGLAASPETYGALEGLTGFLRAQVAMQLAKRLKR